jgi:hypothetical protein
LEKTGLAADVENGQREQGKAGDDEYAHSQFVPGK